MRYTYFILILISFGGMTKPEWSGYPIHPARLGQDRALFFSVNDYCAYEEFLDLSNPVSNSGAIAASPVITPAPVRPSHSSSDSMIFIKGGTFQMGDQFEEGAFDEKPVHAVSVSDFYLGRTELSNREFAEFLSSEGNQEQGSTEWYELDSSSAGIEGSGQYFSPKSGQDDHPVSKVSWYGAIAYCNWLSGKHGLKSVYRVSGTNVTSDWSANGYRLPTEAEWEYAARSGGKKHRFGNGQDTIRPTEANFHSVTGFKKDYSIAGGYRRQTVSVGSFAPNELGLADMSGNVYEWCWDWYSSDYYEKSTPSNPRGPNSSTDRVIRGSSWCDFPSRCRATFRYDFDPTYRDQGVGFRLARSY